MFLNNVFTLYTRLPSNFSNLIPRPVLPSKELEWSTKHVSTISRAMISKKNLVRFLMLSKLNSSSSELPFRALLRKNHNRSIMTFSTFAPDYLRSSSHIIPSVAGSRCRIRKVRPLFQQKTFQPQSLHSHWDLYGLLDLQRKASSSIDTIGSRGCAAFKNVSVATGTSRFIVVGIPDRIAVHFLLFHFIFNVPPGTGLVPGFPYNINRLVSHLGENIGVFTALCWDDGSDPTGASTSSSAFYSDWSYWDLKPEEPLIQILLAVQTPMGRFVLKQNTCPKPSQPSKVFWTY